VRVKWAGKITFFSLTPALSQRERENFKSLNLMAVARKESDFLDSA
jgi:hypothetical protein